VRDSEKKGMGVKEKACEQVTDEKKQMNDALLQNVHCLMWRSVKNGNVLIL
jgi:hypothetical protein